MARSIKAALFAILLPGVSACVDELAGDDNRGDAFNDNDSSSTESVLEQESDPNEQLSVVTQAATTSSPVFTNGTRAAEAWFNRNGGDAACSGPCFALLDAKCDAHEVYVEYRINEGANTKRTNSGGCGTTLRIPLSGTFNISYRACVDQFNDVCGPMRFDHNP